METVTEFVIDLSGSMKDKIDLTKQILLSDIIPTLNYSSRIGIKSFSAVSGMAPVVQELPLNLVDRDAIIATVKRLAVKVGGTPISEAIRQSVATLKEYSSSNKKIVLLTDGEEDKGGDYVAECKKAQTEGIHCEIHIVGIGLKPSAESKAIEISKLTKGTYSSITFSSGTTYNSSVIRKSLAPFYSALAKPTQGPQSTSNGNTSEQGGPQHINTTVKIETAKDLVTQPIDIAPPIVPTKDITETQIAPINVLTKNKEEQGQVLALDNGSAINEALTILRQEIREIKEDISSIKGAKNQEIPEIIEDAELNEKIRQISEKYLYEILKVKYPNRVRWLNENGESMSNHDFEILEEDRTIEYFIECKGTAAQKTTFFLTKNEWMLFLNNTKNYQVYFIQNVFSSPSPIFINNLLDWLLRGKLLPYLKVRDVIKEERVFLTLSDSHFVK